MTEQIGQKPDVVPLEIPVDADSVASVRPGVLLLVNYNLIHVAAEAEARERLLRCVTVDTNGVASLRNTLSGVETLMVVVRVDDEQNATVVNLVREEDDALSLPLPADSPSRIGFFVGYRASVQTLAAAIRNGLYPGVPLVTEALGDARNQELMIGIGGMKDLETDHIKWARQIGLEKLGFDPTKLRGVFGKYHRPNRYSSQWQEKPFVVRPDDLADILPGYDPNSVRTNEFQMLFYDAREVKERRPSTAYRVPSTENVLGQSKGDLGLGFGQAVERQAETTGVRIESLEGAFRIIAVPR